MQLLGKAKWIIVGANCWGWECEVTFVRLAYAVHNILNFRLSKTVCKWQMIDLSWNRKPKMCGDGRCFNVSYKTRQCITHQFMQILIQIMTQSHCESSPGSSDECRSSAGWQPTLRPNQLTWAVSPPKVGSYHPHPPLPLLLLLSP